MCSRRRALNAGNAEAPTFGDYNVKEAFVEFDVPLLSDVTGAHELSIGGAYRYSDYSTVDTTDAYAAHISWAPIESLRLPCAVRTCGAGAEHRRAVCAGRREFRDR